VDNSTGLCATQGKEVPPCLTRGPGATTDPAGWQQQWQSDSGRDSSSSSSRAAVMSKVHHVAPAAKEYIPVPLPVQVARRR
jgi:hypothetical protein